MSTRSPSQYSSTELCCSRTKQEKNRKYRHREIRTNNVTHSNDNEATCHNQMFLVHNDQVVPASQFISHSRELDSFNSARAERDHAVSEQCLNEAFLVARSESKQRDGRCGHAVKERNKTEGDESSTIKSMGRISFGGTASDSSCKCTPGRGPCTGCERSDLNTR